MSNEKELLEEELEEMTEKEAENTAEPQEEAKAEASEQPELTNEEKLEKELSEMKDKYLRLMAEYDNYRKRTAKQLLENTQTAKSNTLADILPVFDNFERAASAESADETYKSGVQMIFKQFEDMLTKLGVEVIDPTGQEFDPEIANAVNRIEDENLGENIVAQTFQKGYKIGDKVIRYAMVVVANS